LNSGVLKHTRRPTSLDSLEERLGKAKSSRSLLSFPCIPPTQDGREPLKIITPAGTEKLPLCAGKEKAVSWADVQQRFFWPSALVLG
jgi:hypothetical protein